MNSDSINATSPVFEIGARVRVVGSGSSEDFSTACAGMEGEVVEHEIGYRDTPLQCLYYRVRLDADCGYANPWRAEELQRA